jgi:hypothetical protein
VWRNGSSGKSKRDACGLGDSSFVAETLNLEEPEINRQNVASCFVILIVETLQKARTEKLRTNLADLNLPLLRQIYIHIFNIYN